MKIINTSRPSLEGRLSLRIDALEEKPGLNKHQNENMPTNIRHIYLPTYEEFKGNQLKNDEDNKRIEVEGEIFAKQRCNSSFSRFSHLPSEIRLSIIESCFASDLDPKIHCVDERASKFLQKGSKFMSNQPISPFLHVCQEFRNHYIFVTKACFAFETYINFSIDTIYVPDFTSREEQFPRFLACESSKKIEKLAMRKDFYCNLPGEGIMWDKYLDMLCALPQWTELTYVFNDNWIHTEVWKERNSSFRDLTAKEKRYGPGACERGFARQWASVLNRVGFQFEIEHIKYRFVFPENPHRRHRKLIENLR